MEASDCRLRPWLRLVDDEEMFSEHISRRLMSYCYNVIKLPNISCCGHNMSSKVNAATPGIALTMI